MTPLRLLALGSLLLAALPSRAEGPEPQLRRFALLVGANDGGRERVRLRYAGTDARAVARVLGELGGVAPQDRTLLLDVNRSEVLAALARLKAQVATAPAGTRTEVLFYYSGHSDEQGLLLKEERLPYRELRAAIDALPADVRIAILDSCASGAFARAKGGTRRPAFLVDTSSSVRGHAILTSSSEDEVSQESDRINGSYFTHHLVSGLRGAADLSRDGRVTLNEAYHFAFNETLSRTEKTQAGPQHAAYDIQLAGTGDLVMTDVRATSAGLYLADALDGHLFVRDAQGVLVVELVKAAGRPAELGLAPGTYRVTRSSGERRWEADVALAEGQRTPLVAEAFRAVAGEAVVTRGGALLTRPDDHKLRFFNLALIPSVSTNDVLGGPVDNNLSVALLAGRSARLTGAALALGANWVDGEMWGVAAGMAANVAGGDVHGAQLSLGGNWAHHALDGAQATVGVNVAAADARWAQLSVGGNVAARNLTGAQLTVGGNVTGGSVTGVQGSVGFNWAHEGVRGLQGTVGLNGAAAEVLGAQVAVGGNFAFAGVRGAQLSVGPSYASRVVGAQLALLNVGGEVHGAQVGLINVAGKVHGAQVGLLNLAHESEVPVGLLSFIGNGQLHVEAYGSDFTPANLALKLGGKHLYTVVSAGARLPADPRGFFTTGLGFGAHLPFAPFSVDVDLAAHSLTTYRATWNTESILAQARAQLALHLAERFALFVGPTFNVRVPIRPETTLERVSWARPQTVGSVQLWPGLVAGIRI